MDGAYDIFKDSPEGPIWIECAVGLRQVTERLNILHCTRPAEYFAYNVRQYAVIARLPGSKTMNDAYCLFKRDENGAPIGIDTVLAFKQVKKRLIKLSSIRPGSYLVYDPTKTKFVELFRKSA